MCDTLHVTQSVGCAAIDTDKTRTCCTTVSLVLEHVALVRGTAFSTRDTEKAVCALCSQAQEGAVFVSPSIPCPNLGIVESTRHTGTCFRNRVRFGFWLVARYSVTDTVAVDGIFWGAAVWQQLTAAALVDCGARVRERRGVGGRR